MHEQTRRSRWGVGSIVGLAALGLLACEAADPDAGAGTGSTAAVVREMTPIELQQTLETPDPASTAAPLVLDVRTPAEFAEGHVPHAINLPHDQLEARLAELAPGGDRTVVVYCKSGKRAAIASEILAEAGFSDLRHLTGDMDGWRAAGLPVEREGS
jgi:phage shock protein E